MTIIYGNFRPSAREVMASSTSTDPILPITANMASYTLFGYTEQLIERYRYNGQLRTSETYESMLRSFKRYREGVDVYLCDIDCTLVESYKRYLSQSGLAPNTVSFYLKRLRATYRHAVDEELVDDAAPFRRISTPMEKTVKRALTLHALRRLLSIDLSAYPSRQFARDLFLFSFYTRGMSFIDIVYLQKNNLKDGVLTYRRHKTCQLLTIRWESRMQEIVNRYKAPESSPYLFNILHESSTPYRQQYLRAQSRVNKHLKKLGRSLSLDIPLTMYCARHSWASIAYAEGIPMCVISEGMGHDSERTTHIYLASLDNEVIDRANRKIMNLLRNG